MRTDTSLVPADYAELHQNYRTYVERLVYTWGVRYPNVEDVASAILEKFMEREMLKEFDPSRNVLFGTFLGGFVGAYVRYMNTQLQRDWVREGTSIDIVVGGDTEGGDRTIYDIVAPKHYDRHEELEYVEFVTAVRQHLAYQAPTNARDKADLVAIWDLMVAQEHEHGRLQVSEIASHFNVSLAGAKKWVKRIREQVALVVEQRGR